MGGDENELILDSLIRSWAIGRRRPRTAMCNALNRSSLKVGLLNMLLSVSSKILTTSSLLCLTATCNALSPLELEKSSSAYSSGAVKGLTRSLTLAAYP